MRSGLYFAATPMRNITSHPATNAVIGIGRQRCQRGTRLVSQHDQRLDGLRGKRNELAPMPQTPPPGVKHKSFELVNRRLFAC